MQVRDSGEAQVYPKHAQRSEMGSDGDSVVTVPLRRMVSRDAPTRSGRKSQHWHRHQGQRLEERCISETELPVPGLIARRLPGSIRHRPVEHSRSPPDDPADLRLRPPPGGN